ncbi:unnamed protein product [Heterosigma akashiwo]
MFLGLEVSLATLFTKECRGKVFLATFVAPESLGKKIRSRVPDTVSYSSSNFNSGLETGLFFPPFSFFPIEAISKSTDIPKFMLLYYLKVFILVQTEDVPC